MFDLQDYRRFSMTDPVSPAAVSIRLRRLVPVFAACLALAACASEAPSTQGQAPGQTAVAAMEQAAARVGPAGKPVGISATGSYLAGRHAQKTHDYRTAAKYLTRALRADAGNRALLRRTFVADLADGKFSAAENVAQRIVDVDAGAPLANLVLAAADIKAGRHKAAEDRLAKIKRRGLSTFVVPLVRAWVVAGRGDTAAAIAALKPIGKVSGFSILYDLHVGLLHDFADNAEQAEAHYRKAESKSRRSTLRVVQALGSLYMRTGQTDRARGVYAKYLQENPDSRLLLSAWDGLEKGKPEPRFAASVRDGVAEALFNVASTLTQENAIELALVYGRIALDLRPDFALAKMLVGGILETLSRNREAIEIYRSVPETSPLWWSARLRTASNLESIDKVEEAIEQLRSMAREKDARSDVMINLGDLLRSEKRFGESVDAYDRAMKRIGKINKRHWTILYSRGIALERSKQWKRAEKDFVSALELNPDQPYVLNYLGYSWVDQGIKLERARKMIERAVQLRPNDGYIVDSLGWVLYRIGKYKDAAKQLERAVELRPQDPTINDHLGDAYWRVGRAVEARFQWRRALSLGPEPDQTSAIQKKIIDGLSANEKPETGS